MEQGRAIDVRELIAGTGGRLDAVLAAALPDVSRARVQRLIADSAVTLNGATARKSERVEAGDRLQVRLDPSDHPEPAVAPDLDVLFEDGPLVAINKPPGIVVHSGPADATPSVAAWFLKRYPDESAAFGVERPGIVHRLDRETSGIVLLAKTPAAQAAVSHEFETRNVQKLYLAVTDGVPERSEALIDAPIGRHPSDRTKMAIVRRGREARTGYEVLGHGGHRALLLVRLYTGRTHQIRVHLAAIDTPVSGDTVYGSGGEGRQLLHAWQLTVPHPRGGSLTVTAPAAEDLVAAIRELRLEALALKYCQQIAPERRDAAGDS